MTKVKVSDSILNLEPLDFTVFVGSWSKRYSYAQESKYSEHIGLALKKKDSFLRLFEWKNGTGDNIAKNKLKSIEGYWEKRTVLLSLRNEFDWHRFEVSFMPHESATVWKIFLLHLVKPLEFPIFDQHVYRAFNFNQNLIIKELPNKKQDVWDTYTLKYFPWFKKMKQSHSLNPKRMDEALFAYGKHLKAIAKARKGKA